MKGSDKPLSPIAKVFIYLGVILGCILFIAIICIAVMFIVPGTSILGYQRIKYKDNTEYKFTAESELSISDIDAIDIITEISDIYIVPNATDGEIKIVHRQDISGFAKSLNADLKVKKTKQVKTLEGENSEKNTLVFSVDEPSGLILSNSSYVYVFVPQNANLTSISARSSSGDITYSSKSSQKNNTAIITCNNLHLRTEGSGEVTIKNEEEIENYYLATGSGSVVFNDVSTINASSINYQTNSGAFNFYNNKKDATLNLTKGLFVKSTRKSGAGPTIAINNLNGNLYVDTFNGVYQFTRIGSDGNFKTVAITTNNSKITMDTVFAQVSILSDSDNPSNNITINNLTSNGATNNFEAGEGSVYIKLLSGSSAFNASSGSIRVDNAIPTYNVFAHSTSGSIDITYSETEDSDNAHKTTILTNSGNVNVRNISNELNLHVLSNSSSALNLSFCAVASCDNIINAKNRNPNITLVGTSDALQHRIASTTQVNLPQTAVGVAGSQINDDEKDSLARTDYYKDNFSYFYRIGYAMGNVATHPYNNWGKILITSTGNATVTSAIRQITELE